jgi:subtilase family serine protease
MTGNTAVTATFTAVLSDLQLTSVSAPPASAVRGGRFTVTDTVTNAGQAGAGSSRTRYYLSTTGTRSSSDVVLAGSRLVAALVAGGNSAGSIILTVPTATPLGTYRLLACADDTRVVTESVETNNCRASATAVVIGAPDLVTAAVSNPPSSTRRGTAFDVTDTVRNQGDATAGSSTTRYYLSLDGARDTTDRLMMGNRPVGILNPADVSSGTVRVVIPSSITPGTYFVLACADDAQRVVEGGGANNCRASATAVNVTP